MMYIFIHVILRNDAGLPLQSLLMSITALSHQVRTTLQEPLDDVRLEQTLQAIDEFVRECVPSKESEVLLFQLEKQLQSIHSDTITHNSIQQVEVLLAVLYRLRPLLTSTSVISTWFDLVLRPALREPRLSTPAINHAKELIVSAAERDERYSEKVGEFRRRLLDLYVLDAYNEGSGYDLLEWAELDQEQREKRSLWKCNLEDVLVKYGLRRPQVLNRCSLFPLDGLKNLLRISCSQ